MKLQRKSRFLTAITLCLTLILLMFAVSCQKETPVGASSTGVSSEIVKTEGLWASATYTEDKSFGEGAKTAYVEVKADDKSITFTLKTDKENLADALLEHKLVEGDDSQFGLYIKKVNGILADYDINKSYWSLCKDGQALMTGASDTKISDGEHYELVYTK